jgi:hypothetical protein
MVFSKVGPNQSIEWGQIRVSKSDGLRKYIDATLDVSEPSFEGKTEARETKIRLAIQRGTKRRQKAKSKT